jgi:hypothetical protein
VPAHHCNRIRFARRLRRHEVDDAFAFDDARVVTSVRVGRTRHSAAQWYLRDQGEIDALLQRLLVLRG